MSIRDTILTELRALFEEEELPVPELTDETVLLDSGLDSLGFAVLVTRLEEVLGFDPFSMMEEPVYPSTLGDFVGVYEGMTQADEATA